MCVCVCPLSHISPLGLLFVVKTLSRTQRAMKAKNFVAFSLKRTSFGDRALPPMDSLVPRPRPPGEGKGLVTIARFLVCAESAVLFSRQPIRLLDLKISCDIKRP